MGGSSSWRASQRETGLCSDPPQIIHRCGFIDLPHLQTVRSSKSLIEEFESKFIDTSTCVEVSQHLTELWYSWCR